MDRESKQGETGQRNEATTRSADTIVVRGASVNNLRRIDCTFPLGRISGVTGPSGAGKSSLVFGVVQRHAERLAEMLLSGDAALCGSIAAAGGAEVLNLPLSVALRPAARKSKWATLATVSAIFPLLTQLFLAQGRRSCRSCGAELEVAKLAEVAARILAYPTGVRVEIGAPLRCGGFSGLRRDCERLVARGFTRIRLDEESYSAAEILDGPESTFSQAAVLVDALVLKNGSAGRVADALRLADAQSGGAVWVQIGGAEKPAECFTAALRPVCLACGCEHRELTRLDFDYRSKGGACVGCGGLGLVRRFDPSRFGALPQESVAQYVRRFSCGRKTGELLFFAHDLLKTTGYAVESPVDDLPEELRRALLEGRAQPGGEKAEAIFAHLHRLYRSSRSHSLLTRIGSLMLVQDCPECCSTRLGREARRLVLAGKSLEEVLLLPLELAVEWAHAVGELVQSEDQRAVNGQHRALRCAVDSLISRLCALASLGMGYLTLSRSMSTLSGGEVQRAFLSRNLQAPLSGLLFLIDEPSTGLHPIDLAKLGNLLEEIVRRGNTVILIDHNAAILSRTDYVLELGPGGGSGGGTVTFSGAAANYREQVRPSPAGHAAPRFEAPGRCGAPPLRLIGLTKNNLSVAELVVPGNSFVVVCGVSGSGKSSLVMECLAPALRLLLERKKELRPRAEQACVEERINFTSSEKEVLGLAEVRGWSNWRRIVDFSSLAGLSRRRSAVADNLGVMPLVAALYAGTPLARMNGYTTRHFSPAGGLGNCARCGARLIGQSSPESAEPCAECRGRRFSDAVLEVRYRGRDIAQMLELTIEECCRELSAVHRVCRVLRTAMELGLGYLRLSQPLRTVSSGERQRLELVKCFHASTVSGTLFVFDEPSRRLSGNECGMLIATVRNLVSRGAGVVCVEHNPLLIKAADAVIELGPGAGEAGGRVIAQGTPAEIAQNPNSLLGGGLA